MPHDDTPPTLPGSSPPGWEGEAPARPITTVAELAEWLQSKQESLWLSGVGGNKDKPVALELAAQAIRNAFRVLEQIGVSDCPSRPPLPPDRYTAEAQLKLLWSWANRKAAELVKAQLPFLRPDPKQERKPTRKKHPNRGEILDDYEANIRIKKYLDTHPKATIRDVAGEVGLSTGKVSQLDAWKRAMAERKAAKLPPKKSPRQLTAKMLAAKGRKDDPAAKVMKDEAIWQWVLEKAKPKEKADMFMLSEEKKAKLIEAAREQYESEHADADDSDD
jgi:hypothetical protein